MRDDVSVLEMNPVDYYNLNHFDDAVELLTRRVKTFKYDPKGNVFYDELLEDGKKVAVEIIDGYFVPTDYNSAGLKPEMRYSPFQIFTKFRFGDDFYGALHFVGYEYMGWEFPYIRVQGDYYKVIKAPDRYGIMRTEIKPWKKPEIIQDAGGNKDILSYVRKFDKFCIVPSNKDYRLVVNGQYNLYAPFSHEEKEFDVKNDLSKIKWSLRLIRHIFGEQYELGLKYMQVLYLHPEQALPILVMVSEERSTGKSTYINWLTEIFGDNSVIIDPKHISATFNALYATKNIIAIEESKFESVAVLEKLKALATLRQIPVNPKFVNPYTIPFYGKLIITSNDEAKFSKVDRAEIRYWVRKIGSISSSNHNILEDLRKEIPYFLYFLNQLPAVDRTKSRQVFTPEEIETEALLKVKLESRVGLHKDLEERFDDWFANNPNEEHLYFTTSDVKTQWYNHNNQIDLPFIRKVLENEMKLISTSKNQRYQQQIGGADSRSGKIFSLDNPYYNQESIKFTLDEDEDKVPF